MPTESLGFAPVEGRGDRSFGGGQGPRTPLIERVAHTNVT